MPPREDGGAVTTSARLCLVCGYGNFGDHQGIEVCDGCGARLVGSEGYVPDLFRMQNVNTRRIDRITSDEEERLRQGYDLQTAFHFKSTPAGDEYVRSQLADDELGFRIDLASGKWSQKDVQKQDDAGDGPDDAVLPEERVTMSRVVPYVQDTRNALLLSPGGTLKPNEVATLGYALKRGIEAEFQLESNELALELMPDDLNPTRLLFYESAEGGAGVLTRIAKEPLALRRVVHRALDLCHFDDALEDRTAMDRTASEDDCIAACYDCLLSYQNQRYHELLDRHDLPPILSRWRFAETRVGGGQTSRDDLLELLLAACESQLERDFLGFLNDRGHALPDRAQVHFEEYGTRADFLFTNGGEYAAVYVDGPYHEYPERARRDAGVTSRLESEGIRVIRVTAREKWREQLAPWAHIVGVGVPEREEGR